MSGFPPRDGQRDEVVNTVSGSGLPALPGTYTATLSIGEEESTHSLEPRGDPDVALTMADYEARFEVALRVRDLTSTVNELMRTVDDLNQIISTTIMELNELLEDYPKVMTRWSGGGR